MVFSRYVEQNVILKPEIMGLNRLWLISASLYQLLHHASLKPISHRVYFSLKFFTLA